MATSQPRSHVTNTCRQTSESVTSPRVAVICLPGGSLASERASELQMLLGADTNKKTASEGNLLANVVEQREVRRHDEKHPVTRNVPIDLYERSVITREVVTRNSA